MNTVSIEMDSRWVKIARSPVYFIVVAFQGVSITFAPLFLYWAGRGNGSPLERFVPLFFAVIVLVPGFYFYLGRSVLLQLRRK
jgi:hypothetical protein